MRSSWRRDLMPQTLSVRSRCAVDRESIFPMWAGRRRSVFGNHGQRIPKRIPHRWTQHRPWTQLDDLHDRVADCVHPVGDRANEPRRESHLSKSNKKSRPASIRKFTSGSSAPCGPAAAQAGIKPKRQEHHAVAGLHHRIPSPHPPIFPSRLHRKTASDGIPSPA